VIQKIAVAGAAATVFGIAAFSADAGKTLQGPQPNTVALNSLEWSRPVATEVRLTSGEIIALRMARGLSGR
jgi:hypothetical protein